MEDNVYVALEQMWFDSFAQNLPWIRSGKNLADLRGRCQSRGPVVVVGAGPSVEKFNHLALLKGLKESTDVLATDRMLVPLMKNMVIPELSVTVDGSPKIVPFYQDPYAMGVDAVLPVYAHQPLASLVKEAYWYVPALDEGWEDPKRTPRSVTRAMVEMSGHSMAGSAYGNSGGFSWSLAEFMGHDPVILVGIDFSYGPALAPSQTPFFKGFLKQREGKVADVIRLDFRYEDNPFGHRVLSDVSWDGYRDIFLKGAERSKITTVNCSSYTTLHGGKIKTMELEQAIKEYNL